MCSVGALLMALSWPSSGGDPVLRLGSAVCVGAILAGTDAIGSWGDFTWN